VYADKFHKGQEVLYVNTAAFVQTNNSEQVLINLDTVSAEIWEDNKWIINYIVQPGDTLSKIASTFGITISHIKKTNNITWPIRPNQKLIITDEEDGIIYTIDWNQNILVFANKYSLNVEDLMTLNYIQDETEILQDWQEIFVPIDLETAYDVWMMERPKPVYKPKTTVTYKPTITKPTSSYVVSSSSSSSVSSSYAWSSVLSTWVFNKNISNRFYAWHCTWYIAATTPQIFPYTSDTAQARPFGWNANQRYTNAKNAWFSVGKQPVVWSIVVYQRWGGWYASAWHVAKVISINSWQGSMVIEEMNWSKKFVVQRRTDRLDNPNIIWYIYMPSVAWTPN
jgi:surface antigen